DRRILVDRDEPRHVGNVTRELRDERAVHEGPGEEAPAPGDHGPRDRGRPAAAARAVGIPDEALAPVAAWQRELTARRRRPELARRRPVRVGEREGVAELHSILAPELAPCPREARGGWGRPAWGAVSPPYTATRASDT